MNGRHYDSKCGRIRVVYRNDYGDSSAVAVSCPNGWNDSCQIQTHTISLEEARDLRYLLDRAIAASEIS